LFTNTKLLAHVETQIKLITSVTEKVPVVGQLEMHVPNTGWERYLPELQEVQLDAVPKQVLQKEAGSHAWHVKLEFIAYVPEGH
jgi:hypothetical protein